MNIRLPSCIVIMNNGIQLQRLTILSYKTGHYQYM